MIKFIFFVTNCLCFVIFTFCLGMSIYFYAENTIIGQDVSIIIISLVVISFLFLFTLFTFVSLFCIFKNHCVLGGYIVILCIIFGGSMGSVLFLHHQYGTVGLLLVLEEILGTTLAYKTKMNILIYLQILFYGIPAVFFFNIVMACAVFFQVSSKGMNETQTTEAGESYGGSFEDIYNEIHQNPQNENPPFNPYYHQSQELTALQSLMELTARMETAIPNSNQDEGYHQQVHTSLSHQDPPSYHEAVIKNIQSTPQETYFRRGIHPIQPHLPQEAPPPYQLWMLRVSKRLKRKGSKMPSTNVQNRQNC